MDEETLLSEAAGLRPELAFADLDGETLASLTRERGVDVATAFLLDRLRRSPDHGALMREIESLPPAREGLPRLRGNLLVVPAALHRSAPSVGGDGALIREVGARLGLSTVTVPLPNAGTLDENARLVAASVFEAGPGPLVLASMSKGGADVRRALEARPDLASRLSVWLNVCGIVRGTPLADDLLEARGVASLVARGVLRKAGVRRRVLSELSVRAGAPLAAPFRAPEGLLVVNVIACPLSSHLTGATAARHERLAGLGPNDGSTLLLDALVTPGLVAPVLGADHYFRLPGTSGLLYRLFRWLHGRGVLPAAT